MNYCVEISEPVIRCVIFLIATWLGVRMDKFIYSPPAPNARRHNCMGVPIPKKGECKPMPPLKKPMK
ncbi:hypothetical protein [Psychrobacter pygoscelis]|uniref:hypothetical protein n=1 Tax=Psychrobacter pygoscelis TaxID=2488563 RepID=UPI0010399991|nr:hypothetical protein [Psychrobacter pygoscelis]